MVESEMVDWLVPAEEWERTCDHVREEWGQIEGYIGQFVVSAMRERMDRDGGAESEELVDRFVRAAGRRPCDLSKNKMASDTFEGSEKVRVTCRIHKPTKQAFREHASENTDNLPGVELAYALREKRQGGRYARMEAKLSRVVDDAEGLLAAATDSDTASKASTTERRATAMTRKLIDESPYEVGVAPIPLRDIEEAIAKVQTGKETVDIGVSGREGTSGADDPSEYLRETYIPKILDRLNYEQHAGNERLFVPTEAAESDRRETAAETASEEMDALMNASPETARTDGGVEHSG